MDEQTSQVTPAVQPAINGEAQAQSQGPATNGYAADGQARRSYTPTNPYSQPPMGPVLNGKPVNGHMPVQNAHAGAKYTPVNGAPQGPGAQQHHPSGQYMVVPPGSMVGPMPGMHPYAPITPHRPTDQGTPLQHHLSANYYPGFVAGGPHAPGPVHGFPWPYSMNNEVPDFARECWPSVDEHTPGPFIGMPGQTPYYPLSAPPMDRSLMVGPMYTGSPGQVTFQMMRTGGGYALQDIDALVKQEPAIPPAVPAMWSNSSALTLAKCLENREGITNVYIRGFLPETSDELLYAYASRFGKIERCKAIIDLDTGLCKGFGFVQFYSFDACENCIRAFFHLGYQASFAQKSRNSRLKDLEDRNSTNVYCTNVPIEWTEADLRRHFEPFRVVSERISRDEKTGVSKEVGFARFETRSDAEAVLARFHNVVAENGVKLMLRFADTKAQKQLKQQSNERRAYRAGEYNYSVEVVQATPSPGFQRLQQAASHFSPNSQGSYPSPLGVGQVWTPATSISPPGPMIHKPVNGTRYNSSVAPGGYSADTTPTPRGYPVPQNPQPGVTRNGVSVRPRISIPTNSTTTMRCKTPSPAKVRAGTTSPVPSRKEIRLATPKSSV